MNHDAVIKFMYIPTKDDIMSNPTEVVIITSGLQIFFTETEVRFRGIGLQFIYQRSQIGSLETYIK